MPVDGVRNCSKPLRPESVGAGSPIRSFLPRGLSNDDTMIQPPSSPNSPMRGDAGARRSSFGQWRGWLVARHVVMSFALSGCAVIGSNQPHNQVLRAESPVSVDVSGELAATTEPTPDDVVALSFSGGGLRASAFSLGALQGLAALPGPSDRNLLQQVRFITTVSGGSLTGAWVGLNGIDSLDEFRRTALLHAGKHALQSSVLNSVSMMRLAGGGLSHWLDEEVFHGATFASMSDPGRPVVWINATNLNQRLPFVFNQPTFDALCSSIDSYPVSEAVAASMAVPLLFAPVVLEKHCNAASPVWSASRSLAPGDTLMARAVQDSLIDYRETESGRYVKLVDGGLTDNLGLSSIEQMRLLTGSPMAPFSDAAALRMRRLLFVVVDSGRRPAVTWNRVVGGPGTLDLMLASIDAAINMNMRLSYDNFAGMTRRWRDDIVAWRCSRSEAEQRRERMHRIEWRCDDVQVSVSRISFDDLTPEQAQQLHDVPTSLTLPQQDVDAVIAAGKDAMQRNAVVRNFSRAVNAPH